ncbi:hypothetical protein O181_033985 [Austropuccinia psidii MF-1]|uniref:Uncharacterized protein n=1 Tax=Austropuccinia psidii MF-1 TaxID=1389203 RepID=A0A9Q3D415_9BASI|nr:hypothetical protein [Austropuccinia psidii MF-1]
MPSTRSEASYNPSSISQKGYRPDYCRSQTVTEGQESVNESQIDKLCHSDANNTFLPLKRDENGTRSLSGHSKSQSKGLKECLSQKEYQILAVFWENCMNSYLTFKKLLGNPNTSNLFNG